MADFIDHKVWVFAGIALPEHLGMLGNETDDIVLFHRRRLETGHAIGADDELVTADTAAFIIQPVIAGPT